ncbi:kinase-like domain-containing protein [Zopfochytrium polystomum]|nr:kinase-like domain-containing protein [Zopfochytrium polystomum]
MESYEPLEVIGSGSFGVIRKVCRKSDGKILARKEIDFSKMSEREKRQLVAEVNILRELKHPNIVRYFERVLDREKSMIYIMMEFCEKGDLAAVIKQFKLQKRYIGEEYVWRILTQLLAALNECHHGSDPARPSHPAILHRDIKPENVFIDGNNNVKLGDFGLSRTLSNPDVEMAKTYVGTPFYMSPELVNETQYNSKSDIWALGCVIYELCSLEPPFQSKTQAGLEQKIKQGKFEPLPGMYSADLNGVIRAMLNVNYMKRPSAAEILKIPRIRACLKDADLAQRIAELSLKEDELRRKETALQAKEAHLLRWEQELTRRETALNGQSTDGASVPPARPPLQDQKLNNAMPLQAAAQAAKPQVVGRPITIAAPPYSAAHSTTDQTSFSRRADEENFERAASHSLPEPMIESPIPHGRRLHQQQQLHHNHQHHQNQHHQPQPPQQHRQQRRSMEAAGDRHGRAADGLGFHSHGTAGTTKRESGEPAFGGNLLSHRGTAPIMLRPSQPSPLKQPALQHQLRKRT